MLRLKHKFCKFCSFYNSSKKYAVSQGNTQTVDTEINEIKVVGKVLLKYTLT